MLLELITSRVLLKRITERVLFELITGQALLFLIAGVCLGRSSLSRTFKRSAVDDAAVEKVKKKFGYKMPKLI